MVDTYLGDLVGVQEKLQGGATDIAGIQVIHEYTLELTIDAPKAYFLSKLTYPTAFVLDRNNVEGNPAWLREPNGTGPFRLANYVPNEVLTLNRNENCHLGPLKLEEVRFILSGRDPLLMYENDEIHITEIGLAGPEPLLDPFHTSNQELYRSPPSVSVNYIGMNVSKPPFDDPAVRQALNHAIDKEMISNRLFQDALPPAKSILPPGFPGYNPDLEGYEYDPERARQLLGESRDGTGSEGFPSIVLTVPGFFGGPVSPEIELSETCGARTWA